MKKANEVRDRGWGKLIEEQESSGETIAGFCERRGIRRQQFFWWRRRLREREAGGAKFMELKLAPRPAELELRLAGGRSLMLRPGIDLGWVREVAMENPAGGGGVDGAEVPSGMWEAGGSFESAGGDPGSGSGAACPDGNCGGTFTWHGFQYTLAPSANGWVYMNDQDGDDLSIGGVLELGLPDFNNQAPPGSPLRNEVTPAYGPGSSPVTPGAPAQVLSSVSYSRSYGAFLACEYGHTLGDEKMTEAWAGVNGATLIAILSGNVKVGITGLFMSAVFDLGGAATINSACSQATYGPR